MCDQTYLCGVLVVVVVGPTGEILQFRLKSADLMV